MSSNGAAAETPGFRVGRVRNSSVVMRDASVTALREEHLAGWGSRRGSVAVRTFRAPTSAWQVVVGGLALGYQCSGGAGVLSSAACARSAQPVPWSNWLRKESWRHTRQDDGRGVDATRAPRMGFHSGAAASGEVATAVTMAAMAVVVAAGDELGSGTYIQACASVQRGGRCQGGNMLQRRVTWSIVGS